MRRVLAALIDAVAVALLGFVGFRFALQISPCGGNLGSCASLTPLVIIFVLAALGLYFGLGHFLWRSTPAQHLFGPHEDEPVDRG